MTDCVVITGHCGGLGRALVKSFSKCGYRVVGIGRDVDSDLDIPQIEMDLNTLTSPGQREKAESGLVDLIGTHKLKALINNAAVQLLGPLLELETESLTESFTTNVIAPLVLTQILHQRLTDANGTVVNINSVHSSLTKPGFAPYSISKSALAGLTRAMALELGRSTRIIEFQPAAIATPMLEAGFRNNPEQRAKLDDYHPTKAIGDPLEIADSVRAIIETNNRFLNGSVINVDGGISYRLHDPI